jgi:hypothetical protein
MTDAPDGVLLIEKSLTLAAHPAAVAAANIRPSRETPLLIRTCLSLHRLDRNLKVLARRTGPPIESP